MQDTDPTDDPTEREREMHREEVEAQRRERQERSPIERAKPDVDEKPAPPGQTTQPRG